MANYYLVTGASSGIGRAIADLLVEKGYSVIGLSRRKPEGDFRFEFYPLDITKESDITDLVNRLKSEQIHVKGLVNCAGSGIGGAIEETSLTDIRNLMEVNVLGLIAITQALLPFLRESQGTVLNVGSVAGTLTIPFQTVYSMSKAAILSFSEGLRLEVKPFGIRVTTLLPGDTKTGFTAARKKTVIPNSPYTDRVSRSLERMEKDEQNGLPPRVLARKAIRLLMKRNPPVTATVGIQYQLFLLLKKWLPHRWVMAVLYLLYGK